MEVHKYHAADKVNLYNLRPSNCENVPILVFFTALIKLLYPSAVQIRTKKWSQAKCNKEQKGSF